MKKDITVKAREVGQRLDLFGVTYLPEYSRVIIQDHIKNGAITVNEITKKPSYIIREGDTIQIDVKKKKTIKIERTEEDFEKLSIPIIFEDEDMLVIDKPAGIAVHPGHGIQDITIAEWFVHKYPEVKEVGENTERPGIVHRLDKDTTGVLLLAKTQKAYDHLKLQFQKRHVEKEYLALVFGEVSSTDGRINQPIARSKRNPMRRTVDPEGKPAITEWKKERIVNDKYTLMRVFPFTGRTHQIRVHMHFIRHPIGGDTLYTFKRKKSPEGTKRQLLHAEKLRIKKPNSKRETFIAPLPEDFEKILNTPSE